MQADTARRIALMDRASPEVISQIEREFEKRLSTLVSEDYTSIGGIDSIVDIINQVDRTTEKNIMENLEMTPEKSLKIISEAISRSRKDFEKSAGTPLVIWGAIVLAYSIAIWILLKNTGNINWNYLLKALKKHWIS